MRTMSDEERRSFLLEGTRTAKVGVTRRVSARYMGEDLADRFADRNSGLGEVLVRIVAERIVAQADVSG
jgi:hypothetical protein